MTRHPTHPRKPSVEVTLSPDMIEAVLAAWEAENPGKNAIPDMGPAEFSRRMMEAITASARIIPDA